jgi:hypothetical protein
MGKFNVKYTMRSVICLLSSILCLNIKAQDKTINSGNKPVTATTNTRHKIMLIPFENRMYLSEIDFLINKESKLNAKQIKATMRDGLNEQFYKRLKSKIGVVDLLDDTTKTRADLQNIYQYLAYQYVKVPDQTNYKPPVKDKEEKTINNGQLTVESNSDARFMNARLKNATLVPYLNGKYKTDVFLFFNELDIKALNGMPGDLNATASRKIILHYTVYTVDAKEINSGIAEVNLPANVNNPTKIINTYFAQLADIVANRIDKAMLVK